MRQLLRYLLYGVIKRIEQELNIIERAYMEGWIDESTLLCLYVDYYEEARKWLLDDYFSEEYFKKRFELIRARRRMIR